MKKYFTDKNSIKLASLKKILGICTALTIACSGSLLAQTTFTGATNNNWSTATNWSPAVVPSGATAIIIPAGLTCNMGTSTYNGSGTIALAGTLQVPAGATFAPTNTVTMNTNGATLSGGGAVNILTLTIATTNANDIVSLTNSALATPITLGIGNTTGTLNLNKGILKIGSANTLAFAKTGTINATTGKIANASDGSGLNTDADGGTVALLGNSGGTVTVNNDVAFYNLNFGTDGNVKLDLKTAATIINGTCTKMFNPTIIGSTNSPLWGPNSTLYINNGGTNYSPGKEWVAQPGPGIPTPTIGVTAGYPNNVLLTNVGNSAGNAYGFRPSGNYMINGSLTIGDGASTNGQVDFANVTNFSCKDFTLNTNSRFTPPNTTMTVSGNWTDNQTRGMDLGFENNTYNGSGNSFITTGTIIFSGPATCSTPHTIKGPSGNAEIFYNMTIANNAYVSLSSPVTVNSVLTITSGILTTTATNIINITSTSPTAISGGGTTAYINGPVNWPMAAGVNTYIFPVGSGICTPSYLPFTLNNIASTPAATATVQAFTPGSGGTVDATMSSLSSTEYWSLSTSTALTTGSTVTLARTTPLGLLAYVAESKTSATGTYTSLAGTTGTASGLYKVSNSNDIGAASNYYFTFGSPPIVSTLAATSITSTSATLNGAFNTGSSKTTKFSYGQTTSYGTTVNTLHSPINSSSAKLDSQYVTGLIANTAYHYLASDGTDNGSDVTFVTAPNAPVVGTGSTPTATGFTANWSAPAAMGSAPYTYTVQVSTDPTFATVSATQTGISSGSTSYVFTSLNSSTQYYYRVEAVNATASSAWSASSAAISTLIVATTPCASGNGSPGTTGTISRAATSPVMDGVVDPVWNTVPSNPITEKINVADEGSGLQNPPNNTATWKTLWDATNLYILVQVTDATLVSQGIFPGATNITAYNGGAQPWDVDGIEFYLDGNYNRGGAYDGVNDFQLRFNLGSGTVTGSSGNAPFSSLAPRITPFIVPAAGGYLLEVAIPWSGAGGINSGAYPSIQDGNKIGIDFSINDNDGTAWRTAQQGWYDGGTGGFVDQYNNTTRFGSATLATCHVPPTVVLPTVTNITSTGATLGATVTSSGDTPLSVRGTGLSTGTDHTGTSNAIPEGGTGVSIYSGPARTGLQPETKYYYLGYATNTFGGTGVSTVASFYTLSALPTVQPTLSGGGCSNLILNWTAVTFPATGASQTGYLVLRSVDPAVPSTSGIVTRVATTQAALASGTTLVTTINSGSTLTYTDASAVEGTTYNYKLIPFTWDGTTADSTYNYFLTSPASVRATPGSGSVSAPSASVTQQPTCSVSTGTIKVSPTVSGLTYSIDGTNYSSGGTFSGLAPNTYDVTAKNSSGCVSNPTTLTINAAPGAPAVPTTSKTDPTCAVPTGSISVTNPDNTLTYSVDGTTFSASTTFNGLDPNTYTIEAKDANGCVSSSAPVTINSSGAPTKPSASTVTPNCSDSTGAITITPVTGLTYSIDGVNYFAYNDQTFTGLIPNAVYQLTAKDGSGCISVARFLTIPAMPVCGDLFIPNLITPNADGKNDHFAITALPPNSSLSVSNRWGDIVYHSTNYDNLWAASGISDGIYYYDLVLPDGKRFKGWLDIMK